MNDERHHAPATLRNREPILEALKPILPARGLVLEIAAGSGEHAVYFGQRLPALTFQPTDPDERSLRSVAAWIAEAGVTNVRAPIRLDAAAQDWPVKAADAALCINMIHIAPWDSTLGLFRGAAAVLPKGAPLYLYGPYIREGAPTAQSNLDFDANFLRARNPAWGLRDLGAVTDVARAAGFSGPVVTEMPANNLSVVFWRA